MLMLSNANVWKRQALGKSQEKEEKTNFYFKGCAAAKGWQPKDDGNNNKSSSKMATIYNSTAIK